MNQEEKQALHAEIGSDIRTAERRVFVEYRRALRACEANGASPEMLHAVRQHLLSLREQIIATHNALADCAVSAGAQPLSGGQDKDPDPPSRP